MNYNAASMNKTQRTLGTCRAEWKIDVPKTMRISQKCRNLWAVWRMAKPTPPTLQNAEIIIRECLETARELGRTVPEPKGWRLMVA